MQKNWKHEKEIIYNEYTSTGHSDRQGEGLIP